MLKFKPPQERLEPKLYFISLLSQANGNVLIWNAGVAAFTLHDAETHAIIKLQEQNQELYQRGQLAGGWRVNSTLELSVPEIDRRLTTVYEEQAEAEKERERQEINDLMNTIVESASRKLLIKYQHLFTPAEIAYMENEIEAYERST